MEIREFAERVLFATSLDEKLAAAGEVSDRIPGMPLEAPGAPGRPLHLAIRRDGVRAPFPAAHRLADEEQRGILLHFFANHELLATELMALVLLKFPDAPAAFRRGIVRTLEEEQRHTRWYLDRMRECGVTFGDFGLNRFFWDAIAPMESPLDYVTRLSLTFEQANLDYSKHYAGLMRDAGDPRTGAILDRIYRDEIGHVGYGLKWFRRWKREQDSEWEAYRRVLRFPLSPSRGKGNAPFNVEGRLRAGFSDAFVREMAVFEQSKGRTPNVFWFNPNAEAAIAAERAGIPFQARAGTQALARDLEILPAFLSRRDDVVLMAGPPGRDERARLQDLGLILPEFEAIGPGLDIGKDSALRVRKINGLRPWAWSPESAALLAPLVGNLPGGGVTIDCFWNADRGALFSKAWSVKCLEQLIAAAQAPFLPATTGRVCESLVEIEASAASLRGRGHDAVALKAPFGAAGQKHRRLLPRETFAGPVRRWAERIVDRQGALIVEPWRDRVHDFSVQYEMAGGGLSRVAAVHLFNEERGQFRACQCGPKFGQGLPKETARFLMSGPLRLYDEAVREVLETGLRAAGYRGPVGVDAFIYRRAGGELALQPIVEINPRYTMGRLTWELMRRVAPGRAVRFELISLATARRAGCPTLREYAAGLVSAAPPVLDGAGRISAGAVALNDAASASQALAVLTVSKRLAFAR